MQLVWPESAKVPARQATQLDWPVDGCAEPAGHATQGTAAVRVLLDVPAAQGVQAVLPEVFE